MNNDVATPEPFALDEGLVLRCRKVLKQLSGECREELRELLGKYLRAAFIATGPDSERAASWLKTARDRATNLLREVEVAEVAMKGRVCR